MPNTVAESKGHVMLLPGLPKLPEKRQIYFSGLGIWVPLKIMQNLGNLGNESPQTHAAAGLAELPTSLPKAFCSNSRQYSLIKDKKNGTIL